MHGVPGPAYVIILKSRAVLVSRAASWADAVRPGLVLSATYGTGIQAPSTGQRYTEGARKETRGLYLRHRYAQGGGEAAQHTPLDHE